MVEFKLMGTWSMAGDPEAVRLRKQIMDMVDDAWGETFRVVDQVHGDAWFCGVHNNAGTWYLLRDLREGWASQIEANKLETAEVLAGLRVRTEEKGRVAENAGTQRE